jgi:hypothetical protein
MKILSAVLEVLHAGSRADRQTGMTKLKGKFLQLLVVNAAKKKKGNICMCALVASYLITEHRFRVRKHVRC